MSLAHPAALPQENLSLQLTGTESLAIPTPRDRKPLSAAFQAVLLDRSQSAALPECSLCTCSPKGFPLSDMARISTERWQRDARGVLSK